MTTSTFATCIIEAQYQSQAQTDLPDHFTAAYTTDPDGAEPATHYVDSGFWLTNELDLIVNETDWPRRVYFGDPQAVIASHGLVPIALVSESTEND